MSGPFLGTEGRGIPVPRAAARRPPCRPESLRRRRLAGNKPLPQELSVRFVLSAEAVSEMGRSPGQVSDFATVGLDIRDPSDDQCVGFRRLQVGHQMGVAAGYRA